MSPSALRPVTPLGLLVERLDQIEDLVEELAAGSGGGLDLRERVREARALAGGLDPYLVVSTSPESDDLAGLAQATLSYAYPDEGPLEAEMLSGHVEGQFLQVLVRATGARRVLEIGMFTGYGALAMAEALPDDGVVDACEIDADVAAFARERFASSAHGSKISVVVGPALASLEQLGASGASYDLVFVDADKPGYGAYLDALLDLDLLAERGLVCVDNTLMQGGAYGAGPVTDGDNARAIAAFNAQVAADERLQQVLVPLRDGITLICRRPTAPAPTAGPLTGLATGPATTEDAS